MTIYYLCKNNKSFTFAKRKTNRMKKTFFTFLLVFAAMGISAQSFNRLRINTEYDYSRTSKSDLSCMLANSCRNNQGHGVDLGIKIASRRVFFNFGYQIALREDYRNRRFTSRTDIFTVCFHPIKCRNSMRC
jgi:hypothetical protein